MKHPATAAASTGPSTGVPADNIKSDPPKLVPKTHQLPEKIVAGMAQIRDDLYRIEDEQMDLIDQLEVKCEICILLVNAGQLYFGVSKS